MLFTVSTIPLHFHVILAAIPKSYFTNFQIVVPQILYIVILWKPSILFILYNILIKIICNAWAVICKIFIVYFSNQLCPTQIDWLIGVMLHQLTSQRCWGSISGIQEQQVFGEILIYGTPLYIYNCKIAYPTDFYFYNVINSAISCILAQLSIIFGNW